MATALNTTAENLHNQPVLQNFPPFLITSLRVSLLIILLSMGNYLEISRNIQTYHNFMLFCKGLFFPKQLNGIYFSKFLYFSVQYICKSEKKKILWLLRSSPLIYPPVLPLLHSMAPGPFPVAFPRRFSSFSISFPLIPTWLLLGHNYMLALSDLGLLVIVTFTSPGLFLRFQYYHNV